MNLTRLSCLLPVAFLAACGGGNTANGGTAGVPTSGSYAWVLKANGPTESLTYGLSLVHAGAPGTEFVVESGSSVLTDTRVVSTGSVDVAHQTTGTLSPYALVYIVGGDVRRVPLQANGKLPSTQVQRAGSVDACMFLTDSSQHPTTDGIDFADPENSRFMVTTAGLDGQCGTADDGTAEVRLDPTLGLVYNEISGSAPIGVFRDPTTFAPRGWIYPRTANYWTPSADASVVIRQDTDAAFTDVVWATPLTALMDDGNQLSVVDFSTGTAPTETLLDATLTGGGGWVGIGYDSDAWYAYRNSGSGSSATWTVLKVSRATPFASVLATSTGQISVASMGTILLYATVVDTSTNSLVAISKSVGVPAQTLETTASSTLTTVQTSAAGVNELWRVLNIGTAAINYELEFLDESGNVLYTSNAGGYPMVSPAAAAERFDQSESRTRFVFANGYGTRAFGDAQLMGFDASTKTNFIYGTLPGSATFGTATVYANAIGGPGSFMGGFAASTSNGVIDTTNSQVYSFDIDTPQSLVFTTTTQ